MIDKKDILQNQTRHVLKTISLKFFIGRIFFNFENAKTQRF